MAKVIENLHERIKDAGKKMLLEDGYEKMTLRRVALECGIGLGTTYNYFPSKEMLVASIMLEDWQALLGRTKPVIEEADCALSGLEKIFLMVREYTELYQQVWDSYGGAMIISKERHTLLIRQLSELVSSVLERFGVQSTIPGTEEFMAETILSAGIRKEVSFERIAPFLNKIMN